MRVLLTGNYFSGIIFYLKHYAPAVWFLKSKRSFLTEEQIDTVFHPFFERFEEWANQRMPDELKYDDVEGEVLIPSSWRPNLPPKHFVKCWRQQAHGLRQVVRLGKLFGFPVYLEHANQNAVEGSFATARYIRFFFCFFVLVASETKPISRYLKTKTRFQNWKPNVFIVL